MVISASSCLSFPTCPFRLVAGWMPSDTNGNVMGRLNQLSRGRCGSRESKKPDTRRRPKLDFEHITGSQDFWFFDELEPLKDAVKHGRTLKQVA